MLVHRGNRARDDAQLGSFLAGMNKAETTAHRIDQINGAAIGDVDSKANVRLIGDQPIAFAEAKIFVERMIGYGNSVSVNLFCGEKGKIIESKRSAHLRMHAIEPIERLGFVDRDVDAGNAMNKGMRANIAGERSKALERKPRFAQKERLA